MRFILAWPFLISFVVYLMLTAVISPLLSRYYIAEKYSNLGNKKRLFDTTLSSTTHAVIATSLSLYLILFDGLGTTPLFSKSQLGFVTMQLSLGHFISDLIICLLDKELRQDKGSLAHHVAGITGIVLGLYNQGKLMFYIVFRLTSEFSTPLVNLFWILTMLKRRDSKLFIFSSLGMLVCFFACRIAPIIWLWRKLIVTLLDPSSVLVPLPLRIWIVFNYLVFDVLNTYWFGKMVKGAWKKLISAKKKES